MERLPRRSWIARGTEIPGLRPIQVFHVERSVMLGTRMNRSSDPREILDAGLAELGLDLAEGVREKCLALARLLESWGQRINLSGHRSAEDIVARLLLDALAISSLLPPDTRSLVDLGSGAGFPGLPIALVRPGLEVRLIESRERRHHFQRAAVRALKLENVLPIRGRIEVLEPVPAEIAIAQAVSPPPQLLEIMLPWVAASGLVVIPGSEQPPEPGPHPRLNSSEIHRYRVPCGGPLRTLWIGRRR